MNLIYFTRLINALRDQKIYIVFLCLILLLNTVIYFGSHCIWGNSVGFEMVQLTQDDAERIDEMLKRPASEIDSTVRKDTINYVYVIRDYKQTDDLIVNYLLRNYENLDSTNQVRVLTEICALPENGRVGILLKIKIKVKSFFWLYGAGAYVEIMLWTIFGVMASILYFVSEVIRDKKIAFEPSEIPSQLAKLFYAPIISMILIFSYEYATGGDGIAIHATKGVLIVSFLLGFYSGRAMELLNRVKELLLPYSSTYKANKPVAPAVNSKDVKVMLEILAEQIPVGQDVEVFKNQLSGAIVKLKDKTNGEETTLTSAGVDKPGVFTGNVKSSGYSLSVSLTTIEGVKFNAAKDVDFTNVDEVNVALDVVG